MENNQFQENKLPVTTKGNFQIRSFKAEMVEEAFQVAKAGYKAGSEMYKLLDLTDEQYEMYMLRPKFENEELYKYSFVVVDLTKNDKICAVRMNKDMMMCDREYKKTGKANLDLKMKIDLELYESIFSLYPELKHGNMMHNSLFTTHPDYQNTGIGSFVLAYDLKLTYALGYEMAGNLLYSKIARSMTSKMGGSFPLEIFIDQREIEGEKVFSEYKEPCCSHIGVIDEEFIQKFKILDWECNREIYQQRQQKKDRKSALITTTTEEEEEQTAQQQA